METLYFFLSLSFPMAKKISEQDDKKIRQIENLLFFSVSEKNLKKTGNWFKTLNFSLLFLEKEPKNNHLLLIDSN